MISWAASCHLARCSGTPICRTLGVQQVETHRYALASTLWGARRAWSRGRHVCTAHGRCADACTRMLGLQSQEAWYTFVEDDPVSASATTSTSISSTTHVPDLWQMKIRGLRSLRLPALPSIYYSSEWQGYEDTVARVVFGFIGVASAFLQLQRGCGEDWLALPNETLYLPREWSAEDRP